MDDDAFGFGELAYDDDNNDLPYQQDNQLNENNNNFDSEKNISPPSKGKKKNKRNNSKKNLTNKKVMVHPETSLKILENRNKPDNLFDDYNEQKESIFTSESPLDWHLNAGEDEIRIKRRKLEIENVLERVSQRILEARKVNSLKVKEKLIFNQSNKDKEVNKLLNIPPMNCNGWYGINSPNGIERKYISLKFEKNNKKRCGLNKKEEEEDKIKDLDEYYQLYDRMEAERRQRMLYSFEDVQDVQMEVDDVLTSQRDCRKLWTEKYEPINFLDLLTDNETNRLTMLWLRLWDSFVFKKKGGGLIFYESLSERDKKLFEIEHLNGGHVLPKQKILVLHGTSGVGKSSLAFVVAKQLGYRPLFIQISEILNICELKNRLENAINSIEISSLFSNVQITSDNKIKETKPVCFIIEGLELASADMIQFLCNWSIKRSINNIYRPIICICSNIYNSINLKQLRQYSFLLNVLPCSQKRLQNRLIEICNNESIQLDQSQLDEMIQSHGVDIRLCLNTLQFMTVNSIGNTKNLTSCDHSQPLQRLNTGLTVSIFDVLHSIFTLDYHKDSRGNIKSPKQRSTTILNLLNRLAYEEFIRIEQLLFVNYASIFKFGYEQNLRISKIFVSMDLLQSQISSNQLFYLYRYLPYSLICIHFICAIHVSRRLKFEMNLQLFNKFILPKEEPKINIKFNKQPSTSFKDSKFNQISSLSSSKNKNNNPFIFRYSSGTSQIISRRVLIGDVFK